MVCAALPSVWTLFRPLRIEAMCLDWTFFFTSDSTCLVCLAEERASPCTWLGIYRLASAMDGAQDDLQVVLGTCSDSISTSGKTMLSVFDPTTTSSARAIVRNEKPGTIARVWASISPFRVEDGSPRDAPVRSRSFSEAIDARTNVSVSSELLVMAVSWRVRHVVVPSHKSLGRAHRR